MKLVSHNVNASSTGTISYLTYAKWSTKHLGVAARDFANDVVAVVIVDNYKYYYDGNDGGDYEYNGD